MSKWNVVAAAIAVAISGTVTANAQTPPPPPAPRGAAEAVTARAGTFVVKMTASRKSTDIPNNVTPACFVQIFSYNPQTASYNEEIMGVFAEGTTNNKTCNFTLAYNWGSVDSASPVSVRMWVQLGKEYYPVFTSGSSQVPARKVFQEFDIPLPGPGQAVELKRTISY